MRHVIDLVLQVNGKHGESERNWIESLPTRIELPGVLEGLESDLIQRALRQSNGVQAEAARQLGISRSDLAYKIKKYRL